MTLPLLTHTTRTGQRLVLCRDYARALCALITQATVTGSASGRIGDAIVQVDLTPGVAASIPPAPIPPIEVR